MNIILHVIFQQFVKSPVKMEGHAMVGTGVNVLLGTEGAGAIRK